ncbi:MAG: tryptophan synthase subunit alpha [Chloroflexi bacterium]|nr:tryptophan synthase subunit alpha [Chloroflexota bacterium]
MNRFEKVFARPGHKALVAFVTIGYPSVATTLETVPKLVEHGCDIIELGIPFSDPLADGATLQEASYLALKQGVNPDECFRVAAQLRPKVEAPLVFLTYYNPVLARGQEKFCRDAAAAGIDGFIIPDLPPQEAEDLEAHGCREGVSLIYMLAPNSPDYRIKIAAERGSGFLYLVSLTGVTGARSALPKDLEDFVARVRKITPRPLCVGFGISTPDQARRVARIADGVIVGSRLVQLMKEGDERKLLSWIDEMRAALDGVASSEQ